MKPPMTPLHTANNNTSMELIMFVIWSGWGILTALFAFLGALVGAFIATSLGAAAGIALAAIVAAGLNYIVAKKLAAKRRELTDPKTGELVVLTDRSSLFFIPMRAWTYIIVILGIVLEAWVVLGTLGSSGAA